ncbi:Kv channel-interacting protein 4-like [Cimex lectularius]|uniref:EF-hand domain-containing protein n=1 Tax=Cimex lectularius TaxID=79782 RepID=A0A8I6SSZ1_CIMLE|nr:Kv channel-interacting protein 4-like [Cimex lectularius]
MPLFRDTGISETKSRFECRPTELYLLEKAFDKDFLCILSKVSRGSVQEKLQWVFGLYDLNGDGLITKKEMLEVVASIYEMLGRSTNPQVEEHSAKDHVEKIFHLIDTNKDGVVTIDELVEWCSRDERILQSLETLDTVL